MASKVHGDTRSLKASQRKALDKLGDRRVRQDLLITPELANAITALSRELNRVLGLLIDRRGRIEAVIVGDARRLYLPDVGRARGGGSRFRGLRLFRTTLGKEALAQDDLTDLYKLQLDTVAAVAVDAKGLPGELTWAHLIPENPENELWQIHTLPHVAQLDWEFSTFIDELEGEFERSRDRVVERAHDRAMIVYVRTRHDWSHAQSLAELHELCRTAGVEVAEAYVQSRSELDPRTAVGRGALEELELRALQLGADILIFGQELNPAQIRSITNQTQLRVIDRTQLILDIFAQRAQSNVGKLQVELAQLKYNLPRLVGKGSAMSRLMGGIGGRGPGESKLEIDRRRARDRIATLERSIDQLSRQRALRRKTRQDNDVPTIAIVGYTNAGKSTLLNTLTNSTVLSEDKLFATLDPTTRRLRFPEEREVILTDTVGFIRGLPEELVAAFRATLEELEVADLLLHVVDASDPAYEEQMQSTQSILADLGLEEMPQLLILNKVDLLDDDRRTDLSIIWPDAVQVSAIERQATRDLIEALDRWLINHRRADVVPEESDEARSSE